jgi:hypothetical protein
MKKFIVISLAVMAVVSCTRFYEITDSEDSPVTVDLQGVIRTAETRGTGVVEGNKPADDLAVSIFRANQDKTGTYDDVFEKAISATFEKGGRLIMNPKQTYLADDKRKSKFYGLYPLANTSDNTVYSKENRTVKYLVDGDTDIMASEFVVGDRKNAGGKMVFNHILTQLVVKMMPKHTPNLTDVQKKEELNAIQESYGKVLSVTIAKKHGDAIVFLPSPLNANAVTRIEYTDKDTNADLQLTTAHTAGLEITENNIKFGHALFIPEDTGEELELTLVTSEYTYRTKLASQKYDKNKSYTFVFKFSVSAIEIEEDVNNGAEMGLWTPGASDQDVDVD